MKKEVKSINIKIAGLHDKQKEVANKMLSNYAKGTKFHVLKASRQSGKTFLLERILIMRALAQPNQKGAIISKDADAAKKVLVSVKEILKRKPQLLNEKKTLRNTITFCNGTVINLFTAGNADAVAGNSFDIMIADEFALWKPGAWEIIRPSLAAKKNAFVILCSTPRGKNDFYDAYTMAVDPSDDFYEYYEMSYTDNPMYDLRQLDIDKKSMSPVAFKQEYLAQFVFGTSTVFGVYSHLQVTEQWEEPQPNKKYFFGIDPAGNGEDDYVVCIIDKDGKVCYMEEIVADNVLLRADRVAEIVSKYNDAVGYTECNATDSTYDLLRDRKLNVTKFISSNKSKGELVSSMLVDIADEDITFPTASLCPKLDNQMSIYTESKTKTGLATFSHPTGMHDDYLDAVMIANRARHSLTGNTLIDNTDIYVEKRVDHDRDYYNDLYEEDY